jgi:DNA-binding NarL/FixJ family response regulator
MLCRIGSRIKVILLLEASDVAGVSHWVSCGIVGYVLRSNATAELPGAVAAVTRGEVYFSPEIFKLAHRRTNSHFSSMAISPQQGRVLRLVVRGATNKEIAARLKLSVRTVEHHRASVMKKAGAHNVAALMQAVLRQGLVKFEQ